VFKNEEFAVRLNAAMRRAYCIMIVRRTVRTLTITLTFTHHQFVSNAKSSKSNVDNTDDSHDANDSKKKDNGDDVGNGDDVT
jgi:hypothetical protein